MLLQHELFFMPIAGTHVTTPFVVVATGGEPFRDAMKRALDVLVQGDGSLRGSTVGISTASADLPVDASMLEKSVDDVVKKFGNSFCIKHGSQVKVD